MKEYRSLVEAVVEEDTLLSRRLAVTPILLLEARGADDTLSFKETLGHIAFWDDFTVGFFVARLESGSTLPPPPVDFEERSREVLAIVSRIPFDEVLQSYRDATNSLLKFLRNNWVKLDGRERQDFWIPLQHRRHHRISLFKSLDKLVRAEDVPQMLASKA